MLALNSPKCVLGLKVDATTPGVQRLVIVIYSKDECSACACVHHSRAVQQRPEEGVRASALEFQMLTRSRAGAGIRRRPFCKLSLQACELSVPSLLGSSRKLESLPTTGLSLEGQSGTPLWRDLPHVLCPVPSAHPPECAGSSLPFGTNQAAHLGNRALHFSTRGIFMPCQAFGALGDPTRQDASLLGYLGTRSFPHGFLSPDFFKIHRK